MHNKPRRSSIRLCPDPRKSDSLFEHHPTRRVSFSRTIFVFGAETQVSQLPLSRVSDESTEGNKPDGNTSVQWDASLPNVSMESEPASMQMDQPVTEVSNSRLPEASGTDEPHSELQDTITCDMSIDSNHEVPIYTNTEFKPLEDEASNSMELSVDDDTPRQSITDTDNSMQIVQSIQYDAEMDIPTITDASQNELTEVGIEPIAKVLQSNCLTASDTSYAISPIPQPKTTVSPVFSYKELGTHTSSELAEPINDSNISITHLNNDEGDSNKTLTESPIVSPEKAKIESSRKIVHPIEVTNATVLTPVTRTESQELFLRSSSRRLLCSLPPLRHDTISRHSGVRDAKHSKVCHTLIGTQEENNRRQRLIGRLNLKVDDRIMSQSLATTPLRQVTPKDWIQATAVQRGDSLSKYGGVKRYEPEYLMPSVSRLQGQVMRLSSYPVLEYPDVNVCTNLRDLQDFLDRNANVVVDKENTSNVHSAAEFEQVIQKQLDCTELNEELMNQLRAVHLSNECRIHLFTNMYLQRQSKVLLQHLLSSTVVKQLNKMSEAQRFDFVAQAHERLHQCSQLTLQEFREIETANIEALHTEKESVVDSVRQFENELDAELSRLETELNRNKTAVKGLRDVSNKLKDTASRLVAIIEEAERIKTETEAVRSMNKQLCNTLVERINQINLDTLDSDYTILSPPGATELFIPWNTLSAACSSPSTKGTQDSSDKELSNMFSPADVLCLSYEDHIYAVRTLFGLVQITLACRAIHSITTNRAESTQRPTIKPEKLIIQTVNISSPPDGLAPVECPAVEALADFVISLCNSREGRNQFSSKLVGLSLERAVWYIEYVMMPYFLLGGDMRAIYLAGYGVEFECTSPPPMEITFTTPGGQRSLLQSRSTMSVSADSSENKSNSMFDRNLSERLISVGPFNITVKLCHRATLSILVLQFILPSLESDGIQFPEASVKVVLGRFSPEEVQRLAELCKVYPGSIYNAVQAVERSLTNMH